MDATTRTECAAPAPARHRFVPSATLLFAVFAATLSFFTLGDKLAAVWTSGAFFDTDDAMRLVEVRTLMHGQAWFDMTAVGLDPPHGVFMHWSRLVDVPLVGLIKLFGLFTDTTVAERLARITFPFILLVALYVGVARIATSVAGPEAAIPMIAASLLSGNGVSQFVPGRIHHSVPQVVILVAMLGTALVALEPRRARLAGLTGLLAALSLAISLEMLPFIAVLSTALALIWIWRGAPMDRMLAAFAAGLAIGLPLTFVITVGAGRYLLPVCDAYSAAHLGAGMIVAVGMGALALRGAPAKPSLRFAAMTVVAAAAAGYVLCFYPACLRDPYAAVDPLVREIWLSKVEEALPFRTFLQTEPDAAWPSLVPVVLGFVACLTAAWRETGAQRERFLILAAVVAAGGAMAFWQVRVFTSVSAIALAGGVYWAVAAKTWCRDHGRQALASLTPILAFPFTATAVAMVMSVVPAAHAAKEPAKTADEATFERCLAPSAFAPLRALAPGAVVAPVDLGSYLLAHTELSPLAAAYHRNNDGNRFGLELMLAPADDAHRMATARNVAYLLTCAGLDETRQLARRNSVSLAADLLAGRTPDWLARVPLPATPFHVFRVLH